MAEKARHLTVELSTAALHDLDEIWDWNADHYSLEHADAYIAFLRTQTDMLSTLYFMGKSVPSMPHLSFIII